MTKAIDITKPLQLADGREAVYKYSDRDGDIVVDIGEDTGRVFRPTGEHYFRLLPDLQNVPEVAPKIDWTKPIEYIDGTPAFISTEQQYAAKHGLKAVSPRGDTGPSWRGNFYGDDGKHWHGRFMAIRNVAEVTSTLDFTKTIATRDGQQVRILTTTDGSSAYPVVGFIGDEAIPCGWTLDGRAEIDWSGEHHEDLVNVEEVEEADVVHASIYRCGSVNHWDAKAAATFPSEEGRATFKITFPKDGKPVVEVL